MSRHLLIALVCVGVLCFTTDTRASGDVLEVRAEYSWSGLAPTWPHNTFSITCADGPDCMVSGQLGTYRGGGANPQRTCGLRTSLPKKLVQALLPAARADLKPVPKPVEVIGHTDDYPRWDVRIRLQSGDLRLHNTSNTGPKGTWNVQQSGRWAVQETDVFGRAFEAMLEPILKSVNGACSKR